MILIFSDQENVQIGLPAGHFGGDQVCVPNPNASRRLDGQPSAPVVTGGIWVAARAYTADGHFLAVDGETPELVSNDASTILTYPGFRLASASEQNAYTTAQQGKSGTLKESGDTSGGKPEKSNGKSEKASAAAANGG